VTGCSGTRLCADDVLLVVDVGDEASLQPERNAKGQLYARAGIPEYWVADLACACVTVYRAADSRGYREQRDHVRGDSWAWSSLTELIAVEAVIPSRD